MKRQKVECLCSYFSNHFIAICNDLITDTHRKWAKTTFSVVSFVKFTEGFASSARWVTLCQIGLGDKTTFLLSNTTVGEMCVGLGKPLTFFDIFYYM